MSALLTRPVVPLWEMSQPWISVRELVDPMSNLHRNEILRDPFILLMPMDSKSAHKAMADGYLKISHRPE